MVEIDLLRAGKRLNLGTGSNSSNYYVLISRASQRPKGTFYGFTLRDQLPILPIPADDRDEATLDLQQVLTEIYDRDGFDLAIDYNKMPVPPLKEADWEWARGQIAQNKQP